MSLSCGGVPVSIARRSTPEKGSERCSIAGRLGELLAESPDEPIRIEKNGPSVAALPSWEEHEYLQRSEEPFWGEGAHVA